MLVQRLSTLVRAYLEAMVLIAMLVGAGESDYNITILKYSTQACN